MPGEWYQCRSDPKNVRSGQLDDGIGVVQLLAFCVVELPWGLDARRVQAGQLGQVAADVLAGLVEPLGLVEEVAPGELPGVLLPAWPVPRADRQFQRGDAAEPQVRAEPGGLAAGQVVVVLVVAGEFLLAPAPEPAAAFGLAALGQVGDAPWIMAGSWPLCFMSGSRIAFGGGQCWRQVVARQARQYGVKTR